MMSGFDVEEFIDEFEGSPDTSSIFKLSKDHLVEVAEAYGLLPMSNMTKQIVRQMVLDHLRKGGIIPYPPTKISDEVKFKQLKWKLNKLNWKLKY